MQIIPSPISIFKCPKLQFRTEHSFQIWAMGTINLSTRSRNRRNVCTKKDEIHGKTSILQQLKRKNTIRWSCRIRNSRRITFFFKNEREREREEEDGFRSNGGLRRNDEVRVSSSSSSLQKKRWKQPKRSLHFTTYPLTIPPYLTQF